ncbi:MULTISPECIES: hypothetical protein [Rugamonas]|uniref:Lipoprotein n=2 Tax=Rugamonas TaxID=212744 RepID=A0A843SD12_9BURK|nr:MULTISPECIES: hypothetical protein [Rugamonas]MQA20932.1 hypothetical protein [Rugamonas rivuli]MQA42144.1 hypothetical protein [Rugamonas aquatica]
MAMHDKIKNVMIATASALAALALSGCGQSGPSESDVQAAMLRQLEAMAGKADAAKQKDEFAKVKVVKCEKGQLDAFVCEIDGPMGHAVGRFKKESEGWVFLGAGG